MPGEVRLAEEGLAEADITVEVEVTACIVPRGFGLLYVRRDRKGVSDAELAVRGGYCALKQIKKRRKDQNY